MDALSPTVSQALRPREGLSQQEFRKCSLRTHCVRAADVLVPPRAHAGGATRREQVVPRAARATPTTSGQPVSAFSQIRGGAHCHPHAPPWGPAGSAGPSDCRCPGDCCEQPCTCQHPRTPFLPTLLFAVGHGGGERMLPPPKPSLAAPHFHGARGTRGGAPWRHLSDVPTHAAGCRTSPPTFLTDSEKGSCRLVTAGGQETPTCPPAPAGPQRT